MPRWLTRLLILGSIAAAAVLVVYRFLNQDEDYDDFDDIDAGFEFQETPVEIDVPAEESASESATTDSGTTGASASDGESGGAQAQGGKDAAQTEHKSHSTTELRESGANGITAEAGSPNGHAMSVAAEDTSGASMGTSGSAESTEASEAPHAEEAANARLTLVNGIGEAYANRLSGLGIMTLGDLAACDPDQVAEQLSVPGGRETVDDWVTKAQELIALAARSDTHDDEQQ